MQAVDQLVILDQAIGIEPADLDHCPGPKRCERARYQQQAVDLLPRVPRQEVADIFIGLEPFEQPTRQARPAHRADHPGRRDEFRLGGERSAHRCDRAGFEQRIGIDRDDDILSDMQDCRVERARLAAVREP